MKKHYTKYLFLAMTLLLASNSFGAVIIINNVDDPGLGLNDPTVVAPVGGNPGTTLGAQRLNVLQRGADIWAATKNLTVDVILQATFQDRGFTPCTPTSGVLGAAGTISIFADFPGLIWPSTWYHGALANRQGGVDFTPGPPDPGFLVPPFNDEIVVFLNPNLNTPSCLTGIPWYYGLDNLAPAGSIDLLNVVLHEYDHGLGFANFIDEDGDVSAGDPPGSGPQGMPDIYTVYTRDNTTGKQWNQMKDSERAASAINTENVVWNGPNVNAQVPFTLDFGINVIITDPPPLAGEIEAGLASFGPPADPTNFGGAVVLGDDGGGPGTATDGCEPLTNGGAINGNVALLDRGLCTFVTKAQNAQAAGATALIIANTLGRGAFGPGGADPTITIPVVGISNADGDDIKANLPGVDVIAQTDFSHRAGADSDNHALLFAPNPVQPGSSISHWDSAATPNLLMEPAINSDLKGATNLDLSPFQGTDIGWDNALYCPDSSDQSPTVVVNGCDSGVPNTVGPYTTFPKPKKGVNSGNVAGGCTIADTLNNCLGNSEFKACVASVTKQLKKQGVLTKTQRKDIINCATP